MWYKAIQWRRFHLEVGVLVILPNVFDIPTDQSSLMTTFLQKLLTTSCILFYNFFIYAQRNCYDWHTNVLTMDYKPKSIPLDAVTPGFETITFCVWGGSDGYQLAL